MGSFPHEFSGYRHVSDDATREMFEQLWGVPLSNEPGLRIPNMMDEAVEGAFKGLYVQGEDIAQSDPDTQHITAGLKAMECVDRAGPVPQRDRALRACLPPGRVVPGKGRHLHQRRAAHQPRAQGDGAARRHGRLGGDDGFRQGARRADDTMPIPSEIMDEIAALDADLRRRLLRQARRARLDSVAVQRQGADRHADHACRSLRARQGQVHADRVSCRPTSGPARASRCC